MKLSTRLFAATAFLLCAAAPLVQAAPVNVTQSIALQSGTDVDSKTSGFTVYHLVAGEFTDTITFTGTDRWALVNASLTTIASAARFNIDFLGASVNGKSVNFTRLPNGNFANGFESGHMDDYLLSGPLTLTVRGYAGQGLAAGSSISSSYSGTFNATQVPEPGTLALATLALFGAGVVVRRRRAVRTVLTAGALTVAAAGAMAAGDLNQHVDTPLQGDAFGLTGAPYVVHTESGSFQDTLTFQYAGTGLVDASLVTIFGNDAQKISFTEVLLNGTALRIDPVEAMGGGASYQRAWLENTTLMAGSYTLLVKGYAGGALASGSTGISASYSTTFNVMSGVPEPESYAMFIAGLGLMAMVLGKRRQRN